MGILRLVEGSRRKIKSAEMHSGVGFTKRQDFVFWPEAGNLSLYSILSLNSYLYHRLSVYTCLLPRSSTSLTAKFLFSWSVELISILPYFHQYLKITPCPPSWQSALCSSKRLHVFHLFVTVRLLAVLLQGASLIQCLDVASCCHPKSFLCNFRFLLFTNAIPVACNMLVSKQRANFFQCPAFRFLARVSG